MNLYNYHSNPNILDQYDNRVAIITELAFKYAEKTNQRFRFGEHAISKDPYYACYYAREIMKCRWPEAEPTIMKDSLYAYCYAKYVIKDRWLEAEPTIMKDPYFAYQYALYVIKSRWCEAEPYIMKKPYYWRCYKDHFGIRE